METFDTLTGTTFGEFQLGKYLGYTGAAHVYLALKPDSNQQVLVNLLPKFFTGDPKFTEHFLVEAGILMSLDHPNIVKIYDFGIERDYPYLVMQNVNGPTLNDLISITQKKNVRIPIEVTIFIITSIGYALSFAHKQVIPHSDVKPHNVILEDSKQVMLTDFGFGRLLNLKNIIVPGAPTEASTSEQFQEKSKEIRQDIYSLGIIFYQLATGNLPYSEGKTTPLDQSQTDTPLISPQNIVPEIPEKMSQIITRAIAKNPDKRYESMEELLRDLTKVEWEVKTTVLPSAQMSGVANFSSRYSSVAMPDKYETETKRKVSLYFLDTGQIVELDEMKEYSIGRRYKNQPIVPDIDLTPFKAFEWGISRLHAKIEVGDDNVTITDLGSSNGTWHAGARIPADTPYEIHHGDLIILGKLRVQVLISSLGFNSSTE